MSRPNWADVEDDDDVPQTNNGLMGNSKPGNTGTRKWADVDDDDDDDIGTGLGGLSMGLGLGGPGKMSGLGAKKMETAIPGEPNKKMVTEYVERDIPAEEAGAAGAGKEPGSTVKKVFKITTIVERKEVLKRSNRFVEARKSWKPFGKCHDLKDPGVLAEYGSNKPVRSEEDVVLEMNKERAMKTVGEDEKFFEHSVTVSEEMKKEANRKRYDASKQRLLKMQEAEAAGKAGEGGLNSNAPGGEGMKVDGIQFGAAAGKGKGGSALSALIKSGGDPSSFTGGEGGKGYLPPSMRQGGPGQMSDEQKQECTLRVTNLSEDLKEGDLQNLFNSVGRTMRVFLAKHREGERMGQNKGFAFITYYDRGTAEKAKDRLNGHGYDNLILQVNWAKPRSD